MGDSGQATELIKRLAKGDEEAGDELLPLVYAELHRLAASYMAVERSGHTLQATALRHEAWLRLNSGGNAAYGGRAQFLALAGRAMRRALIDHARRRSAQKRGERAQREPIDVALELTLEHAPELLELHEALDELESLDPDLVRLVEQRFFAGATNAEIARARGVSTRTIERGWRTAQTWLRAHLSEEASP